MFKYKLAVTQNVIFATLLLVLVTACKDGNTSVQLSESCQEASDSCQRSAKLRSAYLNWGDEILNDESSIVYNQHFKNLAVKLENINLPEIICKKNIAHSVYCIRTADVLAAYSTNAVDAIYGELEKVVKEHKQPVDRFGVIYCPDNSTEIADISDLEENAFATIYKRSFTYAKQSTITSLMRKVSKDLPQKEESFLKEQTKNSCMDKNEPGPGIVPDNYQQQFSDCMTASAGQNPGSNNMAEAMEIATTVQSCLNGLLNKPLRHRLLGEEISNLMQGGSSSSSSSSSSSGGSSVDDTQAGKATAIPTDDKIIVVSGDDANGNSARVTGNRADKTVVHSPGKTGKNNPISSAQFDGDTFTAKFNDGSSLSVTPKEGGGWIVERSDGQGNSTSTESDDELNLAPLPPEHNPRCSPDDPNCVCGAKLEFGKETLQECIDGTQLCSAFTTAHSCCTDIYGNDPLARPDSGSGFICEQAGGDFAQSMRKCGDFCSVFEWEGCMNACANGISLPEETVASFIDNYCWFVSGLECSYSSGVLREALMGDSLGTPIPEVNMSRVQSRSLNVLLSTPSSGFSEELIIDNP